MTERNQWDEQDVLNWYKQALKAADRGRILHWLLVDFPDCKYSWDTKSRYVVTDCPTTHGNTVCSACLVGDFVIMLLRAHPDLAETDVHEINRMARNLLLVEQHYVVHLMADRFGNLGLPTLVETRHLGAAVVRLVEGKTGVDLDVKGTLLERWLVEERPIDKCLGFNLESLHHICTRLEVAEAYTRAVEHA